MRQCVLVLGAGGFIGRRLVAALAAAPWATPVAAVHRVALAGTSAETVQLDAIHAPMLQDVVPFMDAVVNCVAGSPATIVAAARALFEAAGASPHRPQVIHLSTMAVYGSTVGTVDETAELRGDIGAYAAAKVEAERMAAEYGHVVTLRPGCVYGPGGVQWSERIARWLSAHRVGDLGAAGDGTCNLVYVDDVVAAILAALRLPQLVGEAFNLGSLAPPTWNEYFLSFARALGAVPISRISRRRLTLETNLWAPALMAANRAARLAHLPHVRVPAPIPPSLLRSWGQEIRLDMRKAQSMLPVAWTPTEVGLRETAAQMRAAGVT
jgi:nucleoside-diphosphate-sugar epimerase